jgi:hypothetical protein
VKRVGVPRPSESAGDTPQRRLVTASRPDVSVSVNIAFRRSAPLERPAPASGWLTSSVPRLYADDPRPRLPARSDSAFGNLLARLMEPPVEPRPPYDDDGPFATSTCSTL